ncbi:MAG: hypothetical protein Q7J68_05240 [Thermoplasmata archaeon]|nr:hypothetical protein [Thermoplasmata archaeon]
MIMVPPPPVGFMAPPVLVLNNKNSDEIDYVQFSIDEVISWKRSFFNRLKFHIKDNLIDFYWIIFEGATEFDEIPYKNNRRT